MSTVVISNTNMALPALPRPPMMRPSIHSLPTPPSSLSLSPSPPTSYRPMDPASTSSSYRPMGPDGAFRFHFERLPAELQRDILSRLDYQSLIALSCTNRYLHQTVSPARLASPEDKFALVMRAENYFPRHFPVVIQGQERPGNFACYACFRVRGPAHFDADQPHSIYVDERGERVVPVSDPPRGGAAEGRGGSAGRERARALPPPGCREVTLRRFCIECGVRHGLHRPGDSLFTKLRQELWVCRCRMVWQKPSCLKCKRCGGDCPLRAKAKS